MSNVVVAHTHVKHFYCWTTLIYEPRSQCSHTYKLKLVPQKCSLYLCYKNSYYVSIVLETLYIALALCLELNCFKVKIKYFWKPYNNKHLVYIHTTHTHTHIECSIIAKIIFIPSIAYKIIVYTNIINMKHKHHCTKLCYQYHLPN